MRASVFHWHSSGCVKTKPLVFEEEFSFQGPWINRTYLIRIILPGHTHPTSCPSLLCWTWSTKFTIIFSSSFLPSKFIFIEFIKSSACTKSLQLIPDAWWPLIIQRPWPLHFKDYHHISCWSLGLHGQPKQPPADQASAIPKVFWWKRREAGEDSATKG